MKPTFLAHHLIFYSFFKINPQSTIDESVDLKAISVWFDFIGTRYGNELKRSTSYGQHWCL